MDPDYWDPAPKKPYLIRVPPKPSTLHTKPQVKSTIQVLPGPKTEIKFLIQVSPEL